MKLPPGCWCFAREAGKAPTSWVDSYAETSLEPVSVTFFVGSVPKLTLDLI
ncbi:hypothetical protein [Leptolyngbya sp. FACHB-16]|uniref:hypothetical protein n=1 Tax=unclassified Leptolyngbya TaxID=2650499 RepID=UPI00168811BD|nr:hypothetical protein [Leptolyngbya sp. FACHB-16]MBD1909299.1 hypothetical protein [Leptolyngbya sp. FACHB-8]MBD2153529.1 hypothetical protein [Leptolyngbya sp. FACHB-16]